MGARLIGTNRLCLILLALVILYGEFLTYWLHTLSWPRIPPARDNSSLLLLIADPQIPGLRHEPSGLLGIIRRWDCDRYLALSFRWVLHVLTPSAIIFLGDLIDEASETTNPEDQASYATRFHKIYPSQPGIKTIYLPGDNDIGGDGDLVTEAKLAQFEKIFGETSPRLVPVTPWLTLIPVSRLLSSNENQLDIKKSGLTFSRSPDQEVVVALSHWPLLPKHDQLTEKVLALNPEIIFSGHYHRGGLWFAQRNPSASSKKESPKEPTVFRQARDRGSIVIETNSAQLTEVVVPAVSYRMGVPDMAFGVASISRDGTVTYANLWLPKRFWVLRLYMLSAVIFSSVFIFRRLTEARKYCRPARPWWQR